MPAENAHEFLFRLLARARGVSREIQDLILDLSEEELLLRPDPKRWGAGDCLEHLVATGEAYLPRFRAAMRTGASETRLGLYRQRLFGRLFLYLAGPDSQLRIPAMGPFAPPRVQPDVPERFFVQQDELIELIRAAGIVDLNQVRVPSPLSRFLTLSLGEALEMLVAHQQRHLVQARRALQEIRSQCPTDGPHAEATEVSPPRHRLSGRERLPPDR